ncbi:MAG: hypothetical protein CM15mV50_370 [uncultured marine virus]|nr:MAG: hypothetical protein CM15mV50_370 [uncultured marine virus]
MAHKRMGITTAGGLNVGNTTGASGGYTNHVGDNDEAIDCEGSGRVNFTKFRKLGGNRWYFRTAGSGNFGSANGDLVVLKKDGTEIMRWDLSAMTINGDFNDTSDVALKENIADITDATTKIKRLYNQELFIGKIKPKHKNKWIYCTRSRNGFTKTDNWR